MKQKYFFLGLFFADCDQRRLLLREITITLDRILFKEKPLLVKITGLVFTTHQN
jgi:hypothetical protein